MQKKVSIVIPVYNRKDTINRAICSALNQTYDNYEVLIVDDGSDDGTSSIVQRWKNRSGLVRVLTHEKNKGQNYARNTGIRKARGDLISYLDSDDILKPTHVERAVRILEKESEEVVAILTSFKVKNSDNYSRLKKYSKERVQKEDIANINRETPAHFTGLTFKRGIIQKIGNHDVEQLRCTDTDFFFQILNEYDIIKTPEVLFIKDQSTGNRVGENNKKIISGRKRFLQKHQDELDNEQKSNHYARIGAAYLRENKYKKGSQWLDKAGDTTRSAKMYYLIGSFYSNAGILANARNYHLKAISMEPLNPRYVVMGILSYTSEELIRYCKYSFRRLKSIAS